MYRKQNDNKQIVFISGGITDNPTYVHDFWKAELYLKEKGYIVLNPTSLPLGMDYEHYMHIDLAMIDCADILYVLKSWTNSSGSQREIEHAKKLKIKIIYEGEEEHEI